MNKEHEYCYCASLADTKLFAYFKGEELPGVIYDYEHHEQQPTARNSRGEPMSGEELPKKFFGDYKDVKYEQQPDVLIAYGFYLISAKMAEVFGKFDLGKGALYPVKLYQFDRETEVAGEYFLINFGNTSEAVLPKWSKNIFPYPQQRLPWFPFRGFGEDDIILSIEAKDCPDIWVDPRLKDTFFLSNRLVEGLRAEKLDKCWNFKRCVISQMPASEGSL